MRIAAVVIRDVTWFSDDATWFGDDVTWRRHVVMSHDILSHGFLVIETFFDLDQYLVARILEDDPVYKSPPSHLFPIRIMRI